MRSCAARCERARAARRPAPGGVRHGAARASELRAHRCRQDPGGREPRADPDRDPRPAHGSEARAGGRPHARLRRGVSHDGRVGDSAARVGLRHGRARFLHRPCFAPGLRVGRVDLAATRRRRVRRAPDAGRASRHRRRTRRADGLLARRRHRAHGGRAGNRAALRDARRADLPRAHRVLSALRGELPGHYARRRAPRRIDWAGLGLLALWLGALQIMLDKGQQEDWLDSWWIVTLAALTVTGFVAFVMHEWTTRDAIVDLRVLRDRTFAAGVVLIPVVGAVLYATIALLPLFLQTLLGYPALQSGYATSPRGLGAIVGMLVAGGLVGRVDTRWLIATGFGLLALSVHMLGNITLDVTIASVAWPHVLSGLALGFIFVPLSTTSLGTLPKEEIGNATGIYNLMRNVGGSIGISMMTTLLAPRPGPPGDPG